MNLNKGTKFSYLALATLSVRGYPPSQDFIKSCDQIFCKELGPNLIPSIRFKVENIQNQYYDFGVPKIKSWKSHS